MASKSQQAKGGIHFVTTSPTQVTQEVWNKWYDEVHIQDVLKAAGPPAAAIRYDNITSFTLLADKSAPAKSEYLAIYPLPDLSAVQNDDARQIPKSALLKGDKDGEEERTLVDVADFEMRTYVWVHDFEGEGAKNHAAPGKVIITAAMTPTKENETDFDQWYKEEHYGMLAKMKGYLRTRRYRLEKTDGNTGKQAPKFLAVHEFEEGELDGQRLGDSVATEWSKKVMGALEESQIQVWKIRGTWGNLEGHF